MDDKERLLGARKSLERSVSQVVGATSRLLEPLRDLNDEQRDAVVMLGLLMQGIALAKRPPTMLNEDILARFKEELDAICPPLGEVTISMDPCFEATVSYASALKRCEDEDEGRREEECFEAWGPGAQAVMCTMKMIEEMKAEIETRLGRQIAP
jgi:hypothetical protein